MKHSKLTDLFRTFMAQLALRVCGQDGAPSKLNRHSLSGAQLGQSSERNDKSDYRACNRLCCNGPERASIRCYGNARNAWGHGVLEGFQAQVGLASMPIASLAYSFEANTASRVLCLG